MSTNQARFNTHKVRAILKGLCNNVLYKDSEIGNKITDAVLKADQPKFRTIDSVKMDFIKFCNDLLKKAGSDYSMYYYTSGLRVEERTIRSKALPPTTVKTVRFHQVNTRLFMRSLEAHKVVPYAEVADKVLSLVLAADRTKGQTFDDIKEDFVHYVNLILKKSQQSGRLVCCDVGFTVHTLKAVRPASKGVDEEKEAEPQKKKAEEPVLVKKKKKAEEPVLVKKKRKKKAAEPVLVKKKGRDENALQEADDDTWVCRKVKRVKQPKKQPKEQPKKLKLTKNKAELKRVKKVINLLHKISNADLQYSKRRAEIVDWLEDVDYLTNLIIKKLQS